MITTTHTLRNLVAAVTLFSISTTPVAGQDGGLGAACDNPLFDSDARARCLTVVQAVASGQPQLGILIAGGNPTIGTASTQGLRFGSIGRIGVSFQVNAVSVTLPDILETEGNTADLSDEFRVIAPALQGNLAIGLLPGFSLGPVIGGIGSVDLLASATWLPFSLVDAKGFERDNPDFAYGAGVKIGLVRESFVWPGASISLMYRHLGDVAFGDVCPSGIENRGEILPACVGSGDPGEFGFDLINWSTRAAVSKRFLGFGLTGGVGYDRFNSDIEYAFRLDDEDASRIFRQTAGLDSDRWSAFANASYTFLIASIAIEGGWMQGGDPVAGFDALESEFNPGDGVFFGSAGVRISL